MKKAISIIISVVFVISLTSVGLCSVSAKSSWNRIIVGIKRNISQNKERDYSSKDFAELGEVEVQYISKNWDNINASFDSDCSDESQSYILILTPKKNSNEDVEKYIDLLNKRDDLRFVEKYSIEALSRIYNFADEKEETVVKATKKTGCENITDNKVIITLTKTATVLYLAGEVDYSLDDFKSFGVESISLNGEYYYNLPFCSLVLTLEQHNKENVWNVIDNIFNANISGVHSIEPEYNDKKLLDTPADKSNKKQYSLNVNVKTKTIKAIKVKKKAQTVKPIAIKNAQGTIKVTKVKSGTTAKIYKKIKVNSKTGAITFKKGKYAKKTYKIRLKITVSGNSTYESKTLYKTVKVRIK